jgi:hypothetical protein
MRPNSPLQWTQTRKGGLAPKALLCSAALRKGSLGPLNGGVRQPIGKAMGFPIPMVRLLVEQALWRESRGIITKRVLVYPAQRAVQSKIHCRVKRAQAYA